MLSMNLLEYTCIRSLAHEYQSPLLTTYYLWEHMSFAEEPKVSKIMFPLSMTVSQYNDSKDNSKSLWEPCMGTRETPDLCQTQFGISQTSTSMDRLWVNTTCFLLLIFF